MVKLKNCKECTPIMDKKMHCPRCSGIWKRGVMRKIRHPSGAMLDICDNCGGMWIDKDEIALLYNFSKKQAKKVKK